MVVLLALLSMLPAGAAVDDVRDFTPGFGDEAFHRLCRRVKTDPPAAGEPLSWQSLLQRPGEYRGRPVLIAGILRSVRAFEFTSPGDADLGTWHQCELSADAAPQFCTVIVARAPDGLVSRRVRAAGYFLKIRAFPDAQGVTGYAPLVVAIELTASTGKGAVPRAAVSPPLWWVGGATMVALAAWIGLRRSRSTWGSPAVAPRPAMPGDFDWLRDMPAAHAETDPVLAADGRLPESTDPPPDASPHQSEPGDRPRDVASQEPPPGPDNSR